MIDQVQPFFVGADFADFGSESPSHSPPPCLHEPNSYPGRLNDLEVLFEREYTQLARLFGEVVDFVMEHHAHRVNDYLGYWTPLFEQMAHMVALKGGRLLGLYRCWRHT